MSVSRVDESRVFNKSVESVWETIKPLNFKFWSAVSKVEVEGDPNAVGSVRKVTFKDGAVQKYRVLELSDLERFITYEVFESSPPTAYLSAFHTIRVKKVTHDNSSYVEWSSEFSSGTDTVSVVEDSRFKKREAFNDLASKLKA
ncbi:hypothetical protein HK098_004738 [Nowakowskiella sp. JEL0407]|nr:hypothetical protein HK098_004738 [Nowakowskiella sp. JEL0407]